MKKMKRNRVCFSSVFTHVQTLRIAHAEAYIVKLRHAENMVVVESAIVSQLTYDDPVGYARQETFRASLSLPASA